MRPRVIGVEAEVLPEPVVHRKSRAVVFGVASAVQEVHQTGIGVEHTAESVSAISEFVVGERSKRGDGRTRNDRGGRAECGGVLQSSGWADVQVLRANLFVGTKKKIAGANDQSLPDLLINLQTSLFGIGVPHVAIDSAATVRHKRSRRPCIEIGRILAGCHQRRCGAPRGWHLGA